MIDYSLYLVTDESFPAGRLLEIVEQAVKSGVTVVQLREKSTSGKTMYEKAVRLKEMLSRYRIPLIINDRIDLALAVDADGVHIGQDDLPLPAVKKIVPEHMIVGVSARTPEEAVEAERNGADYIGAGSVFPTGSKPDAVIMSENTLEKIAAAVTIPVVAIGGITADRIRLLPDRCLAGVAVVSAIMKAGNPGDAVRTFRTQLKNKLV